AFLTGDARYLDYVHPAEEAAEYEEEVAHPPEDGDEATSSAATTGPADDTADLTPRRAELDAERENVPRVVRKHEGRYPARNRDSQPPVDSSGGVEERPVSGNRTRREPTDEDFLPELPDDLFDWPETRREFGTRKRRQDGSTDGQGDNYDFPPGQEGPPRF
ncbi:MAG TPA: hypothetical protein VJ827_07250, partial [Rubrobacter sp.]|nr:hypothetical protein [Rubrobacter sp.]